MTTEKKIEKIEALMRSIIEDGYKIELVNNEKIAFSSPKTRKKNMALFEKAERKSALSQEMEGNYGKGIGSFLEDISYDYELHIL